MERVDFGVENIEDVRPSGSVEAAAALLVKDGFCVLDAVIPKPLIATLRGEFEEKYSSYLDERAREDALMVGNRRFMITVSLSDAFANPAIWANDAVLSVVRSALSVDCILESFGVVASLGGAKQQHIHRDGLPLFDSQLAGLLPAHALTVAIPLIEMNELYGTTAVLPGTHRYRGDEASPHETPVVPEGSCVLWDYRLLHGGTPNRSDRVRPIVYLTYSRKWWRDADNFKSRKQERLLFPSSFLQSIPEATKHLFSHV